MSRARSRCCPPRARRSSPSSAAASITVCGFAAAATASASPATAPAPPSTGTAGASTSSRRRWQPMRRARSCAISEATSAPTCSGSAPRRSPTCCWTWRSGTRRCCAASTSPRAPPARRWRSTWPSFGRHCSMGCGLLDTRTTTRSGGWTGELLDSLEQIPALIAGGAAGRRRTCWKPCWTSCPTRWNRSTSSDGGGMEVLERAAALHLEACRMLRPDPLVLAAELFERAWDDEPSAPSTGPTRPMPNCSARRGLPSTGDLPRPPMPACHRSAATARTRSPRIGADC